ncbi:hypothetical protein Tco_1482886 [Tanacetum coccineum]
MKNLRQNAVKSLRQNAVKSLRQNAVKNLRQNAVKSLRQNAVKSLRQNAVKNLRQNAVKSLRQNAVKNLRQNAVKSLRQNAVKSLRQNAILLETKRNEEPWTKRSTVNVIDSIDRECWNGCTEWLWAWTLSHNNRFSHGFFDVLRLKYFPMTCSYRVIFCPSCPVLDGVIRMYACLTIQQDEMMSPSFLDPVGAVTVGTVGA